jgi:hypothetical protein
MRTLPSLSTDKICSQLGRVRGITVSNSCSNIMAARGSPRRLHAAVTSDDALNLQRMSASQSTQFIRGLANKPRIVR